MGRSPGLILLPFLLACPGPKPETGDTDPPAHTGDTGPVGRCRDGGWGSVRDPDAALHVSPTGDDSAAGTEDAPLASLGEAVARAEAAGGGEIAMWTGHYQDNVAIGPRSAVAAVPIRIAGCGELEVEIRPSVADDPILFVSQTTGVELAGIRLVEGRRALRVTGGSSVHTEELVVEAPVLSAVVIDGVDTFLDAAGLSVRVEDGGDELLAGIVVDDAELNLQSADVDGAVGVAILVAGEDASAVLRDVVLTNTRALGDGTLGRGLHVQMGADVEVDDLEVRGAGDAGVFGIVPGSVSLRDVTVSEVAGGLGEEGEELGDGIVLTGVYAGVAGEAALFPVQLDTNAVLGWRSDLGRPGIYVENMSVTASGNVADPGDGSASLWADEATVLGGEDSPTFQRGSFPIRHDAPDVAALFLE